MVVNLKDSLQSWALGADGAGRRVPEGAKPVSAHDYFMTNPSLSGRGSARRLSELARVEDGLDAQGDYRLSPLSLLIPGDPA